MPTMTRKPRKTKAQLEAEFLGTTKLHKLLKIALADLAACERDKKRYEVRMDVFIQQNGKCTVCLAGACLVRHGLAQDFAHSSPEVVQRAYALDSLRMGMVRDATAWKVSNSDSCKVDDRDHVEYEDNRKKWWSQMRTLLTDLRKANI